ncbi:MAG: hypothetical protein U1E60_03600 [Reyranellaceae bacterium]
MGAAKKGQQPPDCLTFFIQPASSEGDAAVFADFDRVPDWGQLFQLNALNDNELEIIPPTLPELLYLRRGLSQPGGKLPLFDLDGQEVEAAIVQRCLERGWTEPWFNNPLKPGWLVCKLTMSGRDLASAL